jgi:hypothetical protein
LTSLFGGGSSSLTSTETPQAAAQSGPQAKPSTDVHGLIMQAAKDLEDYQRLTSEGKLGEAGQRLDELKGVINRLNALQK